MPEEKNDGSSDAKQHPYSPAVLSSLIIGVCGLLIKDTDTLQFFTLFAPATGYGTVEIFKSIKKKWRLKQVCDILNEAIEQEQKELQAPGLSRARRAEITTKIDSLKQLIMDHKLAGLDIKTKKEE